MDPLDRLRRLCLALPGATERLSHGEPSWFAGKKQFVMFDNHHHNREHLGFWCAAPPGAQEVLLGAAPGRFFRPPYVGGRGWLGVYLDVPTLDWDEVESVVLDAYRTVAPKRLLTELETGRDSVAARLDRPPGPP